MGQLRKLSQCVLVSLQNLRAKGQRLLSDTIACMAKPFPAQPFYWRNHYVLASTGYKVSLAVYDLFIVHTVVPCNL